MNEHFESLKSVYSNTSFFTLQKKTGGSDRETQAAG